MIKMKESGVEWIGLMPDSWTLIRFKDKFHNSKQIAGIESSSYDRLALTMKGVIKRDKEDNIGLQPKEFDNYQVLNKGDFVFKMIDLQNVSTSRVGLSDYTGIVSPAYIKFSPKDNQDSKFIYYYLMSMYYNEVFNSLGGDGVRSSLSAEHMGLIKCPYPDSKMQVQIADFLDKKCSQIHKLIAIQEEEIEKLKQYKQAVISEVVTKGLDHNVKMKDSGIEWIGEIPEDWSIKRLKNIGSFTSGISNKKPEDFGFGYPFVNYKNIYKNFVIDQNADEKVNTTEEERKKYNIRYGDLFFTGSSETIDELGFSSVAMKDFPNAVWNGFCIRMRPYSFENYNPKYFLYLTRSDICRNYLGANDNSITRANLSQSRLGSLPIVFPNMGKQNMSVQYLDKVCEEIDNLIKVKQMKIQKLQDYKKSLIYEYVTGKMRCV